ncbi:hypothetical protein EHV15_24480 [Paenibacillus oralis]|uniref:DUF7822 domain-containing protein n=1 Tax=Paenibacillus oralis TaxID=2490856 RepID=A0A3P3U5S4_9BACL|nr:SEL1-like repeat protein [Paenibacillus oralis]RRJ65721.1 hypothetical protein EHV15_24480 [Paenibacillus oralis]
MSHRVYLYNVSMPSQSHNADKMMMEWGYEMPLLLQPLLLKNGKIAGNNYNHHTEPGNAGLYYDAQAGIENLKRFYDFLEQQPLLIEDKAAFAEAKNKLVAYLEKLKLPYFHLDAWDVFNMDDIPHAEQAETWLVSIARNNELITNAMENGDISLLRYADLQDVNPAFKSFAELLNYKDYQYGWAHIWQSGEEDYEVEIFEENGLWGLKDEDGNLLLAPQFDEFYGFAAENLAVVTLGGKYGYVHKSGRIAIPLIWDDAFDFEYGTELAIVQLNDKFGLIDVQGRMVAPAQYESLELLDYSGYFTAKKDGKWGVLNDCSFVMIDFEFDEAFDSGNGFYHTAVKGQKNRKIFNEDFIYIGEYPLSALEPIGNGLILVKPHKHASHNTLYKKDGTILAAGFDKINRQTGLPNLLLLRKGKKHGALGLAQESLLLPYEYDALIEIQASGASNWVLARKDGQKGIFDGDTDHPSWLFPLDDYESIRWLYDNAFALRRGGLWGIGYTSENLISGFEFDLVVRKVPVNGFAYAFIGPEVYVGSKYGLARADKDLVMEDAQDQYYNYYFDDDARQRLLTYAAAASPDDVIVDEYTSVETLYNLGLAAYETGDFEKSIHYDTLAAEKGHPSSMNNLANLYYTVDGYLDDDKAFYWYEKGAMAGYTYAMNGLGVCYQTGVGTAPDAEKALYWLGKAADNGNALAYNNLGSVYYEGQLVPQDIDAALYYYEQGEAWGSPDNGWLGYLHEMKGNPERAFRYYWRDYEDGSGIGAFNLGICYSQGVGTTIDIAKPITYFKAAVERSYLYGHIELARIYGNEEDFRDEQLARQHIALAEQAGLDIPDE